MVIDPTAIGPPVPAISGESLLDDPDLRVVAVKDVETRDLSTLWMLAMGAAWAAYVGLLVAAAGPGLVRRVRRLRR